MDNKEFMTFFGKIGIFAYFSFKRGRFAGSGSEK